MPARELALERAGPEVQESALTWSECACEAVSFPTASTEGSGPNRRRDESHAGVHSGAGGENTQPSRECQGPTSRDRLGFGPMGRWSPPLWIALLALPWVGTASQAPSQPERGEQILNAACTTCHDTRPIDTRALDEEAWTKQVKAEIAKGAEVKADDVKPLVDFLVKYHGPLPDGPGKELVLNICTQCHDLQRVKRERLSPEGWLEVLEAMLNEGAPLSEKDFPDVLRYLARNFRPER